MKKSRLSGPKDPSSSRWTHLPRIPVDAQVKISWVRTCQSVRVSDRLHEQSVFLMVVPQDPLALCHLARLPNGPI